MCLESRRVVGGFLVVCAVAVGCGTQPAEPEASFQVRLLTSSPVTGRWERAAEQGLGRIAAELDAGARRLRAGDDVERRQLLDAVGQSGADLVFCVGSGFEETLYTEAAAFPETQFVMLPSAAGNGNVAGVDFLPGGAGYAAGVVAYHLGGGATGVLRGTGGPWLERLEEGFVRGVLSVDQAARCTIIGRPQGPRELAARNVKVALYATDTAEGEVLEEAREAGVALVVTEIKLLGSDPDVVAAVVHLDVAEAMVRMAREVRDGTFRGRPYTFDLGSGVVDVVLNPSLQTADLEAIEQALDVAKSEVTAGIVELEKLGM